MAAGGNNGRMFSALKSGRESLENPVGIPPNLVPIVSIASPSNATKIVQASIATIEPGTRSVIRGRRMIIASHVIETARAGQLIVFKCPTRTCMRGMNALGTVAVFTGGSL